MDEIKIEELWNELRNEELSDDFFLEFDIYSQEIFSLKPEDSSKMFNL